MPVSPPPCAVTSTSVVESQVSVPSDSGASVGTVYAVATTRSTAGASECLADGFTVAGYQMCCDAKHG